MFVVASVVVISAASVKDVYLCSLTILKLNAVGL